MRTNEVKKVSKKKKKLSTIDEKRAIAKENLLAVKTAIAKYGKQSV